MQVATVGNNAHSCDGGIITDVKGTMSECEPRLPSYEEAVAMPDCAKLPSYSVKFSARFHPYKRPMLKTAQEVDRLFNTMYDEEYVPLDVPPARLRFTSRVPPLVPRGSLNIHPEHRARELEMRVQRLNIAIFDFIEGVRRANQH